MPAEVAHPVTHATHGSAAPPTVGACSRRAGRRRWSGRGCCCSSACSRAASLAVAPVVDGRSFGGFLAHRIACAVARRLPRRRRRARARLRRAPTPRWCASTRPGSSTSRASASCRWTTARCRSRACADAPDDRDLDVHRTDAGERATVFTRVLRRGGSDLHPVLALLPRLEHRLGGLGRDLGAQLAAAADRARWCAGPATTPASTRTTGRAIRSGSTRTGASGRAPARTGTTRAASRRSATNRWMRATGWTRVSRGSHAGHIPVSAPARAASARAAAPRRPRFSPTLPGVDLRERTSTGGGPAADPARDAAGRAGTARRTTASRRRGGRRCTWIPRATGPERRSRAVTVPARGNRLERRMNPAYASFGRSPLRASEPS